ncbi:class II aldolase/adducin family protein, partial [Streptomyces sp. SAS_269]|uniref:class II aldolase/adducin family protein n=1 Tax=Streptomyces sp. SAS_269 TaxID=3412749 RepID=UPI00403C89BA
RGAQQHPEGPAGGEPGPRADGPLGVGGERSRGLHAVHATAVSTLVTELPPIHYMTAALGGSVRVAPYAAYGTDELAGNMLAALAGRSGCLLRNHGTVTYGATLDQAYDRTAQLEWMCRLWLTASSVPGLTPALLTEAHIAEAGARLKGYGQRR